ncbi:MAG: helix-turn-helix domain-containing protein [Bryobacterales bacterium]|nr:helix-turn-helix domain-containing protein [Bryobacterales bacterium]
MNTLLTEEDVAECLHVSLASIRRWRLERRGPQFIKVGSLVRYRPEDLESWLASLPTGGAQPAQAQTTSGSAKRYHGTVKVMSS